MGLVRGALEPLTRRLRPEGLSLNATFGGTVKNASQNLFRGNQLGKV